MQYLAAAGYPFLWSSLPPFAGIAIVVLLAWSLVWKGFALWRAAKRGDKVWFIIFLIVNTVGILEIIYLFFITGAKAADAATAAKE